MPTNLTLFSVNAILILSTDDRTRILTKYYSAPHAPPNSASYPGANPYPSVKEQKAFEKGLLEKTNKQTGDVILYDGRVVVYKMEGDVMLYVVGGGDENEILLFNVVLALRDSLAILLKFAFTRFLFVHHPCPPWSTSPFCSSHLITNISRTFYYDVPQSLNLFHSIKSRLKANMHPPTEIPPTNALSLKTTISSLSPSMR